MGANLRLVEEPTDSSLARRFAPSRGYTREKYDERGVIRGVVLHQPGQAAWKLFREGVKAGPWRKRRLVTFAKPLDGLVWIYQNRMDAAPHYAVHRFEVVQLVPERLAAWHCGSRNYKRYLKPNWGKGAKFSGWRERCFPHKSPVDLASGELWLGGSVNDNVVGLELLREEDGRLHPETLEMAAEMNVDLRQRHEIPTAPGRLCDHFMVDPFARVTRFGEPWDLDRRDWRPTGLYRAA